jgi:hypothetical protein
VGFLKICYLRTFVVAWTLADSTIQTSPRSRIRQCDPGCGV